MGFSLSNLVGDPFAISTVTFGIISWVIALAGAAASPQDEFPHFSWWGIIYELLVIVLVIVLYLNNNIELYKFTLVGLLSVGFLYSTNSANSLVYSSNSANLCCAAGCIMISMLFLIWIVYFGGHPESPTNQYIDSFSLKSHTHNHGHLSSNDNQKLDTLEKEDYKTYSPVNLPASQSNSHFQDNNLRQSQLTVNNKSTNTPYMSSSQLNGLENFSSTDVHQKEAKRETLYADVNSNSNIGINYRYKARALYSYDANPGDINEISFIKDEILEVDDIDGKWWQARRSNGQVGICPSNYVKLLD